MNTTQNWEYVGFWKRFCAMLVDTIMLMVVTAPILYLAYGAGYWSSGKMINGFVDILVSYVIPTVVIIWLWHRFGSTPGKMLLGARIVDATTGDAPTMGQLVARYFGYILSVIPLGLGLLWVAFDPRKQGWHDKLANTVVIGNTSKMATPESFKPPI